MAWFRLISAAFDSSVWPYTRPVPLSQVSPYTAEFFWRIMSDAEVARLRGLICSLRLFFGTFGSGIANQTWRDFGEKPEKQTLLSLHYSESSTIEAPSSLGFLLSIAAGRKSPFVFSAARLQYAADEKQYTVKHRSVPVSFPSFLTVIRN